MNLPIRTVSLAWSPLTSHRGLAECDFEAASLSLMQGGDAVEKEERIAEFARVMKESFVDGRDAAFFDYAEVTAGQGGAETTKSNIILIGAILFSVTLLHTVSSHGRKNMQRPLKVC